MNRSIAPKPLLAAAALAMMVLGLATAQAQSFNNPVINHIRAVSIRAFKALDRDEDGFVDEYESLYQRKKTFKEIDYNGDGLLRVGEYMGYMARLDQLRTQCKEKKPPPAACNNRDWNNSVPLTDLTWRRDIRKEFNRLDRNLDRWLTKKEFEAPGLWFIARYDKNGDNEVSQDEYVRVQIFQEPPKMPKMPRMPFPR